MACNLPDIENFRNNLKLYQTLLQLSIEFNNRGISDARLWITDERLLRVFGAKTYQEIPQEVRRLANGAWRMNASQAGIVSDAISRALTNRDPQTAWRDEMKGIRKDFIEVTPKRDTSKKSDLTSIGGLPAENRMVKANYNRLIDDVVGNVDDDSIVDHYQSIFPSMSREEEAALRELIRSVRQEWAEVQAARNRVIAENYSEEQQTEFLKRISSSRFFNTPGYRAFLKDIVPKGRFNEAEARARAEQLVKVDGVRAALDVLKTIRASEPEFFPILAAAILNKAKVRVDADVVAEVLEMFNEDKYKAGLTLRNVGEFYKMLGLASTAGKVAFFRRVRDSYAEAAIKRANQALQQGQGLQIIQQIQQEVFDQTSTSFAEYERLQRIAKKYFPNC